MSKRVAHDNDDDFGDDFFEVTENELLVTTHSDSDDDASANTDEDEGANDEDGAGDDQRVQNQDCRSDTNDKKRRKIEALKKGRSMKKEVSSSSSKSGANSAALMRETLICDDPDSSELSRLSLDVTNFLAIRKDHDVDASSDQISHALSIESIVPLIKKKIKQKEYVTEAGMPRVLIMTASAIRATEIIKELSKTLKVRALSIVVECET